MASLDVRKLLLHNFTCHARTELELLPTGVHLLTGSNGSGKSSLAEAVAMACWGQSLRGKVTWRDGQEGTVALDTDRMRIVRKRVKSGRSALVFHEHGKEPVEFDSMKKAQVALESILGSFEEWRKTSVFSSSDAASLTLSTDAERKRLLETLIGADRFDPALVRCRLELRGAASDPGSIERSAIGKVANLDRTVEADRLRLDAETQRVLDTEASLAGMPRIPDVLPDPPVPPTREEDPAEPAKPPPGPPLPPKPTPTPTPPAASLEALPACPPKPPRPAPPETPPRPICPEPAPLPPIALTDAERQEIARLHAALVRARVEIGRLEARCGELASAGVREQSAIDQLLRQRDLLGSGRCPTCEQPTDKVLSGLAEKLAEAEAARDLMKRQADEERTALQEQLEEVRDLASDFASREARAQAEADAAAHARVQQVKDGNDLARREHATAVLAWETRCREILAAHQDVVSAWESACLQVQTEHEKNLRAVEARNAERKETWRREQDAWEQTERERRFAWVCGQQAWEEAEAARQNAYRNEMSAWQTICARNQRAYDDAVDACRLALRAWEDARRDRDANLKLRDQLRDRLVQAKARAVETGEKLDEYVRLLDEAKARVAVLEACERVLGLRGVRAAVLGKALAGINAASNAWLSRIPFEDGRHPRIVLSATTERKDGGESDAISLLVHGGDDDAPREYLSCSGGERRRVDIALLLGLADVAAAAHGTSPGCLFFDEVYDALDQTGIDAVCSMLDVLAAKRAVVVITHDQNLIERIRPVRHFRFSGRGRLSVAA